MIKWAAGGLILDLYDDIYLSTFQEDPTLLEKLGSTTVLTQEALNKIPDDKFGLIILAESKKLRRYPLHDSGHVRLAQAFLEKNASKLTSYMCKVAGYHIAKAGKLLGVTATPFIDKYATSSVPNNYVDPTVPDHSVSPVNEISVKILPDSAFALVKSAGSKTFRMYPIDTAVQVKQGADHFAAHNKALKPIERVKIASAILARAGKLGVEVKHEEVLKYASAKENPNFGLFVAMRKDIMQDEESTKVLDQLIEKRAEFKGQSFGRALEMFDEAAGLNHFWDVTIPDPYSSCFAINDDKIDAFGIRKTASETDKIESLAKSARLNEVFSDSAVKQFRENPVAIFNSLPEPTKRLLLSME